MQRLREIHASIEKRIEKKIREETSVLINQKDINFHEVRGRLQGLILAQGEMKKVLVDEFNSFAE